MITAIKNQHPHLSCQKLIANLGCNKSSFYRWKKNRLNNKPSKKDITLKAIRQAFKESRGTYGSPRIYHKLQGLGYSVSEIQ